MTVILVCNTIREARILPTVSASVALPHNKCSDDFLSKSLIALIATVDSAQVGLTLAIHGAAGSHRPARKLRLVNQDHPDVVDIGQRRAGPQQVGGGREEGRGVVVVEESTGLEAERRHCRECGLIDDGSGGIGGTA